MNVAARKIRSVVLQRFTSTTHLVDGGQRTVELPILRRRSGGRVVVGSPANANVLPPGPYMLFAVKRTAKGPVPSKAPAIRVVR